MDQQNSFVRFDSAIIVCEGGEEAMKTGNLLGWQRFATINSFGGKFVMEKNKKNEVIFVTELLGKVLKEMFGQENTKVIVIILIIFIIIIIIIIIIL